MNILVVQDWLSGLLTVTLVFITLVFVAGGILHALRFFALQFLLTTALLEVVAKEHASGRLKWSTHLMKFIDRGSL